MQVTYITITPEDLKSVIQEAVERTFNRSAPTTPDSPRYTSLKDAMRKHGVSASFLYRLSSQKTVGTRKVGKRIQFDTKELEGYFDKSVKRSVSAIDTDLKTNGVFPTLKGKRHE